MAFRAKGVAGEEGKAIAFILSARKSIADDCKLEVESFVEYGVRCPPCTTLYGSARRYCASVYRTTLVIHECLVLDGSVT